LLPQFLFATRFLEINQAGYAFAVLRDFYVVHMNHPRSSMTNKNEMTEANRVHWQALQYTSAKKKMVK
jgi:hypothetical protein